MSQVMRLEQDDASRVACDNCDWTGTADEADMISDFEVRVSAGEVCPAGQCPECGALAHLVEEPSPPAAAPSRATPAIVAALQQAVARVEIANGEGNMILSAWLPDARAALDMHESEQTAPAIDDRELPEILDAPPSVDHADIVALARMITKRAEKAANYRSHAKLESDPIMQARAARTATVVDDDTCELCVRMRRLCSGDKSALDLDPSAWPDAPRAQSEESTEAEVKSAAAADRA